MNLLTVLAQNSHDLGPIGGGKNTGLGPWSNLGEQKNISEATGALANIISNVIGIMTIIAGIWFIFQFIIGAYGFITAGGDKQKVTSATQKITSALIGLVIVIAAYALISLGGEILGFEIFDIQSLIEKLGPK